MKLNEKKIVTFLKENVGEEVSPNELAARAGIDGSWKAENIFRMTEGTYTF